MKKLINSSFAILLLAVVMFSCKKKPIEAFIPEQMFTPTGITITGGDTIVTISWPASLFSAGSGVTYTLEISKDSTFQATPDLSLTVNGITRTIGDDTLTDRVRYFARVKANATNNSTGSNWITSSSGFTLIGVQIFKPLQSSDIIDNAVILNWITTPGVSKIVLTDGVGNIINIPLTSADNDLGQKLITGLTAGTSYTAEIFAGTRSKGLLNFTTKTAVTGSNVIDLRGIDNRPQVLYDTLPQIASGSIVLLRRGAIYTIPASYVFNQSVSIISGLGFGDPATISLSGNFDASGIIDSLMFSDITIANAGTSSYFMNVGSVATIGILSLTNVTTKGVFNNSFIRLKTSGDVINNLNINNCIIDSFGIASKYAVIYASASSNAKINNITINNSTFYSFYYFIRQDGITGTSLNINSCTFNDMIYSGGYFINYSGTFPSVFNISNSIFGSTIDPTNANGIKSSGNAVLSNCYMTSDCVFSANPITGATVYAGTAATLFASPATGDFTIADNSFAGRSNSGDPRWRQ